MGSHTRFMSNLEHTRYRFRVIYIRNLTGCNNFFAFMMTPKKLFHCISSLPSSHQGVEKDTICGSGGDHRGQRRTGNHTDPQIMSMWSGIWHYTQTLGCRERRVDVAVLTTSGCDHAKSSSTSWVHLYHHRVVTYNFDIQG